MESTGCLQASPPVSSPAPNSPAPLDAPAASTCSDRPGLPGLKLAALLLAVESETQAAQQTGGRRRGRGGGAVPGRPVVEAVAGGGPHPKRRRDPSPEHTVATSARRRSKRLRQQPPSTWCSGEAGLRRLQVAGGLGGSGSSSYLRAGCQLGGGTPPRQETAAQRHRRAFRLPSARELEPPSSSSSRDAVIARACAAILARMPPTDARSLLDAKSFLAQF